MMTIERYAYVNIGAGLLLVASLFLPDSSSVNASDNGIASKEAARRDREVMAADLPTKAEYNERSEITVRYLIRQLQKCDPDMPAICETDAVAIRIDDSGERLICNVKVEGGKVVIEPKSPDSWGAGYPSFVNDQMPADVRARMDEISGTFGRITTNISADAIKSDALLKETN